VDTAAVVVGFHESAEGIAWQAKAMGRLEGQLVGEGSTLKFVGAYVRSGEEADPLGRGQRYCMLQQQVIADGGQGGLRRVLVDMNGPTLLADLRALVRLGTRKVRIEARGQQLEVYNVSGVPSDDLCGTQGDARFDELCAALTTFRRIYNDTVCC
jgi:hypothetical protein